MKSEMSMTEELLLAVPCHSCGASVATVWLGRTFLCGQCAAIESIDEQDETPVLVCDRCPNEAKVRLGDRFLCGRCALGSSRIGVVSLAGLIERFTLVVGEYLDGLEEEAMRDAHEVGLEAGGLDAGILDLAILHHGALALALRSRGYVSDEVARVVHMAAVPLANMLATFDDVMREERSRVVKRAEARERELLTRARELQEEDRRRLADALHDDPIQVMTAVALGLEALTLRIHDPQMLGSVRELKRAVSLCIDRLRNVVFEVRADTLEREGLESALRQRLEVERQRSDLDYWLDYRLGRPPDPRASLTIFRIAEEALRNVQKHSGARRVDVQLADREEGVLVQVRDDGLGFDPVAAVQRVGHLGLVSMRERAQEAGGWFRLTSAPGRGTTVEYWIPTRG